jgi:hypothetical protein
MSYGEDLSTEKYPILIRKGDLKMKHKRNVDILLAFFLVLMLCRQAWPAEYPIRISY